MERAALLAAPVHTARAPLRHQTGPDLMKVRRCVRRTAVVLNFDPSASLSTETNSISGPPNHTTGRSAVNKISLTGIAALTIYAISSASVWAQDAAPAVTKPAAAAPAAAAAVKPAVKKPAAPPAAATAATPATPAVPGTSAATPATPAKPAVKKAAAPSPCQGLDEKSCSGVKACSWIVPKDANDKTGKVQDPYCRKVAGVALKKPAVQPAATAAKTAAPASNAATALPPPAANTATATPSAKTVAKAVAKPAAPAKPPAAKPPAPAPAQ